MNKNLKKKLFDIARREIVGTDPSHDYLHAARVCSLAEKIALGEKADVDVVIPAALFHDVVNYPKTSSRAHLAPKHSALKTRKILLSLKNYPRKKVAAVEHAIEVCSFKKNIGERSPEAWIVQDADGLESSGAISIMRTFSSTGQFGRPFYHEADPFARKRETDAKNFALDLFFSRLLVIPKRLKTKTARQMIRRRHEFLLKFLRELKLELDNV